MTGDFTMADFSANSYPSDFEDPSGRIHNFLITLASVLVMSQKIIVTGGSGRLGRHVIRELLDHDYEVLNLDRVAPPTDLCPSRIVDLTHADDA